MSTLKVNTLQTNSGSGFNIDSPLESIPSIDVTGSATIGGGLNVTGVSTVGVVTGATSIQATNFYGSGANLTGIAATDNVRTSSLVVSGISTFTTVKVGTAATLDSSGINVTGVITTSQLSGGCLATIDNMSGIHTLGVTTAASTFVTLRHPNQTSNISNGDFVVGTGITVGTTVSAGAGTSSLTLSLPVGINSNANPLAFYKHDKIVTPAIIGSQLCRVWVNFNGTGTVFIRSSYNVSSITDNGTGDYTVNFTTALADANYSAQQSAGDAGALTGRFAFGYGGVAPTTTAYRFFTSTFAGSMYDPPHVAVAIFR